MTSTDASSLTCHGGTASIDRAWLVGDTALPGHARHAYASAQIILKLWGEIEAHSTQ